MIISSPFYQSPLFTSKPTHPNKSSTPKRLISTSSSTTSSPKPTSSSTFYDLLGVPIGASNEQLKSAYRKLARVCHPDVAPKDTSAEEFMNIHTAYSTLLDPEKRAEYDRRMVWSRRRFTVLRAEARRDLY
ncbi:hypothetical protein Leryth_018273 [Lithospermum erythrorhizon]|nr:hypothetical protein Leryth_018273 [Lithospermum erythrorhizon]